MERAEWLVDTREVTSAWPRLEDSEEHDKVWDGEHAAVRADPGKCKAIGRRKQSNF